MGGTDLGFQHGLFYQCNEQFLRVSSYDRFSSALSVWRGLGRQSDLRVARQLWCSVRGLEVSSAAQVRDVCRR